MPDFRSQPVGRDPQGQVSGNGGEYVPPVKCGAYWIKPELRVGEAICSVALGQGYSPAFRWTAFPCIGYIGFPVESLIKDMAQDSVIGCEKSG